MPMWVWIAIGVGAFLFVSLAVSLVVACILGTIADNISALAEADDWTVLPPARSTEEEDEEDGKQVATRAIGSRH
jgi:hypothetical protein